MIQQKNLERVMSAGEILLYTTKDGEVKIDVLYGNQNIWLTQKKMALLFGVKIPAINKHLKNIFESEELNEEAVISILETTAADGKRYSTKLYSLDAIIGVGYRVNSRQATDFRIWATKILKEFVVKGFVLDSQRLENGSKFGQDYFDELLEKVKEIRASERRFYQKITDIYAECSADYDQTSEITKQFYAQVQNKLHFAIHEFTAAEIIHSRANHKKEFMGLTTWKNAPRGKILKSDIGIAKNYLSEFEIKELNHIVNMYLDYAQMQASKKRLMMMQDWVSKLDAFLSFNEMDTLKDSGKISTEIAKALAEHEYEKYRVIQDRLHKSDFDKLLEESTLVTNVHNNQSSSQ
jgi:hypothetical protein